MASCSRRTDAVSPDAVRIVHLNGQLDEFPAPVTVKRVLQNHPNQFICWSRDLFAVNCRPLQPEEELLLGELYFLLPLSILNSDLSVKNLVALAARLYATARKEASRAAQRRRSTDSTCDLPGEDLSSTNEKFLRSCDDPELKMAFREHLISKSRSWRPRLDTIQETGFAC